MKSNKWVGKYFLWGTFFLGLYLGARYIVKKSPGSPQQQEQLHQQKTYINTLQQEIAPLKKEYAIVTKKNKKLKKEMSDLEEKLVKQK